MRIFFYVQWLLGIGHLQRSLRIAEALVGDGVAVTLACGGPPAPGLKIDPAIDIVQLPPVRALDARFELIDEAGRPLGDALRAQRREKLLAALAAARPDAVIIEGFPFARRAFAFELDPLVAAAKRAICSVRDIVTMRDDPARHRAAIDRVRSGFAAVLVHGDPDFIPFAASFAPAAAIADRLLYTGYVANPAPPDTGAPADTDTPTGEVLVSAGGGAAGAALMRAALDARRAGCLADAPWRLLTGMNFDGALDPPPGVTVERFRSDFPAMLRRCRVSVSQCGYNTALDIVAARAPSVLVPFAAGNETEQLIRAEHLAARGVAEIVREEALSAESLGAAIARAATQRPAALAIDTGGAARSARIVAAIARGDFRGEGLVSRGGDGMIRE